MKQTIKELALLVGAQIRSERMRRNFSQEFLACKIGKSAQYLSLLENGDRCGSVATYLSIANEFKLSLSELFTDAKEDSDSSIDDYDILELFYGCSSYEKRVMMTHLTAIKKVLHSESKKTR